LRRSLIASLLTSVLLAACAAVRPRVTAACRAVSTSAELASALATVRPGDCLALADGAYAFPVVTASGSAEAPIVVRAAHRSAAAITSGSLLVQRSSHLVLEGLTFASQGSIRFTDSQHCRLTRFRIHPIEQPDADWVIVDGTSHHLRIDHNDFGPLFKVANMVMLDGDAARLDVVQHIQIDHNLFHDIHYSGGNNWEAIRAGRSWLAPSSGFITIEDNLFLRAAGDPETVSIKSSDNVVRRNTFRATAGQITLRHGNRNQVQGNIILGEGEPRAGGIRLYGADNAVTGNYLAGVQAGPAINIGAGDGDGTEERGTAHYRVYRCVVSGNTIVGGAIVESAGKLPPVGCTVSNNVIRDAAPVPPGALTSADVGPDAP
jgi:hypothetical protein